MTDIHDTADLVSKALRRAWQLGQTYWQQADSEYQSHWKKADATQNEFDRLEEDTRAAILTANSIAQPAPSFADAYQGAMEEVAIWKRRALEAEDLNRKFIAEINGPTHMGEPTQHAPSVPREAIDKMLTQLMDIAVSNGANSVSMPDEYVEVAAWLCGIPAQPAPEVLSDLTALLREATDILKWYGNGLHIKRLSGRIDWDAERAKLSRENFEYSFEAYDGTEYYVEDGSRACQLVDKLENALDLACNINNAQPAPSVPDGWKEAAIAWEVCASIHREYGKGKDPFFNTRQGDFVKRANDARAMLAAAPEAKP